MRARTEVVVEPGGVLGAVRCEPPLTVRQVRRHVPGTCALCLVGTAAGPLAGDDLALSLTLRPGAHATLEAAGAQIAQGGVPGRPTARMRYEVALGAGACLDADPGALVVAVNADVEVAVRIDLAADSALTWRETVVLGRSGEAAGKVRLRWDVRRDGKPLLRQDVDLADPALRGWIGMHAAAKALTTTLRVAPGLAARTEVRSPTDVTQRLAPDAELTTSLQPELRRQRVDAHPLTASSRGARGAGAQVDGPEPADAAVVEQHAVGVDHPDAARRGSR